MVVLKVEWVNRETCTIWPSNLAARPAPILQLKQPALDLRPIRL
jgi:hypothetical protein